MRHLLLLAATSLAMASGTAAEISDPGRSVGLSVREYLPDEGGSFTQVSATSDANEEYPARFVDLGPLPDQFRRSYVVGRTYEDEVLLAGTIDIGSDYRLGLLYELPTFLEYDSGTVLLATSDPDGGGAPPGSTPSSVPLPAAGLLLLAAVAGPLALRRRR